MLTMNAISGMAVLALCFAGSPQDAVKLQGLLRPDREVIAVSAICFGQSFGIKVENLRSGVSRLETLTRGKRPATSAARAQLEQFIKSHNGVRVASTSCVSRNSVEFGLSGISGEKGPKLGQDEIRMFRIQFD